MNKTWKIILIMLAVLLVAGGLVIGGFLLGSARSLVANFVNQRGDDHRLSAIRGVDGYQHPGGMPAPIQPFNQEPGRMQSFERMPERPESPRGLRGESPRQDLEPMTIAQARDAITAFLVSMENDELEIGTVILFENHAYAAILESGSGAFEVIVCPNQLGVFIQPNPWNLKYQSDTDRGRGVPGFAGGALLNPEDVPEMTITPEQALVFAQTYLDEYLPDAELSGEPQPFPGYYTIFASTNAETRNILHVNGYTGQTFAVRRHAAFVEISQ